MEQVTDAGIAPVAIDDVPTSDGGEVLVDRVQIPTPFIAIATPSMTASCTMAHRASMIELRGLLVQRGIPHAIFDRSRMMYLDRVRDFLCTQFLEDFPDATDLFLIDDDVGFPAEKVIEFAIRPELLLLGAPPKKEDHEAGPHFTVRFLADISSGEAKLIQNNGLIRIDRGPAGFLRIKRSVLQTMIDADKCVRYREPETGRMLWHFFSCGVGPDPDSDVKGALTYWGEDTVFIQRAINCGIDCWVDPNIHFAHTGLKTWQGNLYRELLRQHGKTIEPEGLAPAHVAASSPVPAHNEAAPMDDYPKYVRGLVAQDAEDESRIEREWQAANPGAVAPAPEPVDLGTPPDGVSASTPVVADAEQSTAELEAKIEADLDEAAALTVKVAAPAEVEPVTTAENTPAEPVEEDPTVPVAGLDAPPPGENEPAQPTQPASVDQTAEVDTGSNPAETLAEEAQTAPQPVEVDPGMPAGELTAEAAEIPSLGDSGIAAPAAEPAADLATEPTAAASESPLLGADPAADQVEPAQVAEPVQEAPAEVAIAGLEAGAAAEPVDAPAPISAPGVAAEVEQPAPGAPLAAAGAPPASDQPLGQPPGPLGDLQEETAAAGDGAQPAATAAVDQAAAAAAAAASPGAAGTEGAATEPDASSAAAEAEPADGQAPAQAGPDAAPGAGA